MSACDGLWKWLYRMAQYERDLSVSSRLRCMRADDFKRAYYDFAVLGRDTGCALWILRMIGRFHQKYPFNSIPADYPIDHRFEREEDLRTAKFFSNERNNMQPAPIPRAPAPAAWAAVPGQHPFEAPYGQALGVTPEESIEQAKAIIAKAEAAIEARQEADALRERLDYEFSLAQATAELIRTIRSIKFDNAIATQNQNFAKFRKELAPLAESYGFRIVRVGDKSVAVLTQ